MSPPLQAFYLVMGVAITAIALGWLAEVVGLPAFDRRSIKEDRSATPPGPTVGRLRAPSICE